MTYSMIGILAAIILAVTNRDLLWERGGRAHTETERKYRTFLLGIIAYYITDILWGILEARRLTGLLFADTELHFAAMAAAVMLWTRYVASYLENRDALANALSVVGRVFLCFVIAVVAANVFYPILFRLDADGAYHAGFARNLTLAFQILLFLLTSLYTLYIALKSEGVGRRRHFTVCVFGAAMVLMLGLQYFFPLLPLYSMGYLLGTCLLHSFIVEDKKEEYRRELEEALRREREQKRELSEGREVLTAALAAAEDANRAKTAFLSDMSHEIRTPMNAIIGLNNIAVNDPSASGRVKEYLEKIGASAQHLQGIIDGILDMSRIESGRMIVKNEEFSFAECLQQINAAIGGQCRDRGLKYECQTRGKIDDYYVGDALKLKQVLNNILGNAVKFTPAGGSVRLVIEEGNRFDGQAALRFVISDTGIGMSAEYLPHLFEAFSREDASSTGAYGSAGLGMPITKSIVELMNGQIRVESEKGKGTTVTVALTFGESGGKTIDAHEGPSGTEDLQAHAVSAASAELKGRRMLLAEDIAVNAEIVVMLLGTREIDTDVAENGRIAVEAFENHPEGYYDAILMDMRMPEMDGLEAARAIRASSRADARTIPIIALTANAFEDDVKKCLQAGMNAHLSKPVAPEALFEILEKQLHAD